MVPWCSSGHGILPVSCDWFAVSCMLGEPRDGRALSVPQGWSAVQLSSTAVWADRFFLLDADGNKMATLLCSPRTPKMDARRALLQVANRWLYLDCFKDVLEKAMSVLPMVPDGLNRVDLCCDFEMTPSMWRTMRRLAAGSAYVKQLREGVVWWQTLDAGKDYKSMMRVPHCITFGSKDSIFKWKVYYKWLELQQAAPEDKKPYISDMWRACGMDERSVWRCEVSVSGTNRLAGADGNRLTCLRWFDDKVELFRSLYADKFVVRADEGHADKRNDTILPFLDIDGSKLLWHAMPKGSRDESDAERRVVCKLWSECCGVDVQANRPLFDSLRSVLGGLVERASNMQALQASFGVSASEVAAMLSA